MKQHEIFKNAQWISGEVTDQNEFFFVRGRFYVEDVEKADLLVIGLGYFHCYINSQRVSDDLFLPLNTDYEPRPNYPTDEILTSHRIYVPKFDIKDYLKNGENEILIHFGGGWYTQKRGRGFGDPKAIWRIVGQDKNGAFDFVSSQNDMAAASFVTDYYFQSKEYQDLTKLDASDWKNATIAKSIDTEYLFTDCPADAVRESLNVVKIKEFEDHVTYDATKNVSGYPVLEVSVPYGEIARIEFSEEILPDGELDQRFAHAQNFYVMGDGKTHIVRPLFTWFAFRYMSLYGQAKIKCVEVVNTKADMISSFESDNECLNWINETFINTQLCNMHSGIPSDCPHLERRGYTGDGQLSCHAVMNILDVKNFYLKWIYDIVDCQDTITGHVQYTAPYIRSGGGPGGWGCAIVEVPYRYYQHYGDKSVLEDTYPNMLKYFEYLEAHSENGLVISDKAGEWCLGDWCTPEQIVLPAPFVNNYFYVKSLIQALEIARLLGKEDDIEMLENRINERKKALMNAYFNTFDGNFLGAQQGANAFAVDIGIGDRRTYENLVRHYKFVGCYDTGIFGTDVVTRVLFEHGDAELAFSLLVADADHSFEGWRKHGATTFWEYWYKTRRNYSYYDRSHNHPMFGAVTAYFYDYIVGIRQTRKSDSTSKIVVSPVMIDAIKNLKGSRVVDDVDVCVLYKKENAKLYLCVKLSKTCDAELLYNDKIYNLDVGENCFEFDI